MWLLFFLFARSPKSPASWYISTGWLSKIYLKRNSPLNTSTPPVSFLTHCEKQVPVDVRVEVPSKIGYTVPDIVRDLETVNCRGVKVNMADLGRLEDPYGPEILRRTEGMSTADELLGFLRGLNGEWGTTRKKRRVVDASDFGDFLPKGWRLSLCIKRKGGRVWLFCRCYLSYTIGGIWAGMHTVRYFDGKTYEWVGISRQPNILGKDRRIDKYFCHDTVEEIVDALTEGESHDELCSTAIKKLKESSSLSLKMTLQSIREGRFQPLDQCFRGLLPTSQVFLKCLFVSEHNLTFFHFCRAVLNLFSKNMYVYQQSAFHLNSFGEENQEDVTPPPSLMEHPPLAVFVNGVSTAMNELRLRLRRVLSRMLKLPSHPRRLLLSVV